MEKGKLSGACLEETLEEQAEGLGVHYHDIWYRRFVSIRLHASEETVCSWKQFYRCILSELSSESLRNETSRPLFIHVRWGSRYMRYGSIGASNRASKCLQYNTLDAFVRSCQIRVREVYRAIEGPTFMLCDCKR